MKKLAVLFLALVMTLCLCACGDTAPDTSSDTDSTSTTKADTTTTTAATEESADGGYVVTVVDGDNNPIAGAILQMCKLGDDGSCTPGNPSDAAGKVTFNLPEDEYKVSFIVVPAGYTYAGDEQEFYFEEGATELTIALAKA